MVAARSIPYPYLFEYRIDTAVGISPRQYLERTIYSNFAQDVPQHFVRKMHMPQKAAKTALAKWLYDAIEQRRETRGKNGRKLSQSEVARAVGLDPSMINKAANGARSISAIELLQISECLGAPIPTLAELEGRNGTQRDLRPGPEALSKQLTPDELTQDQERVSIVLNEVERINQEDFGGEIPFKTFVTLVAAGLRKMEQSR